MTLSMKRYTLDENLLRKILLSNPMLLEASIADVTIDSVYGDIEELSNNRYVLKLTEEAQKLEYVYIKFQVVQNEFIQDFFDSFLSGKSILTQSKQIIL